MDRDALIELVRRENGILLDPNDPVFAVKTIVEALAEEPRKEIRDLLCEIRTALAALPDLARIEQSATRGAVNGASERAAALAKAHNARTLVTLAAIGLAIGLLVFVPLGYMLRGSDLTSACLSDGRIDAGKDGRKVCTVSVYLR